MPSRNRHRFTTVLLLIFLLASPVAVAAQDQSTPEATDAGSGVLISIRPHDLPDGSRFEATVEPGQSAELTAVLQNFGDEPIELLTYTSDVVPSINGGLKIAERDSEHTGTTLWMEFLAEEFTLQPNEAIERPIIITVPEGTPPGQYVNAVAMQTAKPVNEGQGGAFEQYFRKVVSVYITVPGEMVSDFTIGEPEVYVVRNRASIQIPVANTGNVRLDLITEVTLVNSEGDVVHRGETRMGPVYNGQEVFFQLSFSTLPPGGDYTFSYSFTDYYSEVARSVESIAIEFPEAEELVQAPFSFENVIVEPNDDPILFANVSIDVVLAQSSYRSTRLTLSVFHNGELVEDFVLAENLSLSQGTTVVSQRYLPATSWESGTYTFSLRLENVEGDQSSILFEQDEVATLEVP